jgi:aldehyde dehydrogenase (NAD+)
MQIGDALDPETMIGPMSSSRHRDRVEGYIRTAQDEGARLVTGGGRPDGRGWFVEPTVFADVTNDQTIAGEEVFGPVLSVIAYDGEEDAVPDPAAPFGGVKGSGLGRELGPEGLAAYQQLQSIYLGPATED